MGDASGLTGTLGCSCFSVSLKLSCSADQAATQLLKMKHPSPFPSMTDAQIFSPVTQANMQHTCCNMYVSLTREFKKLKGTLLRDAAFTTSCLNPNTDLLRKFFLVWDELSLGHIICINTNLILLPLLIIVSFLNYLKCSTSVCGSSA